MPKVTTLQTNFTAGEFTPKLSGRVDIEKYRNACKLARNVIPVEHGGMKRREGTKYIGEVKNSTKTTRLIPFVYSSDESYVLEFGDRYMRVWMNGAQVMSGGVPYEISTNIFERYLTGLDYTQGEDTLFIFSESGWPVRVRRFASDNWVFDAVTFKYGPIDAIGERPNLTLTLSSTGLGGGVNFTTSGAYWLAADVGRTVSYSGGLATVTSITSATIAVCTITSVFPSSSLAPTTWTLNDSPQATLTPSGVGPVGSTITLTLDQPGWRIGIAGIDFVRVNGGLLRLSGMLSTTVYNAVVEKVLTGTTPAPPDSWTVEGLVWFGDYPRTGTIHGQRLIVGGSPKYPQTIWGSAIGDYFDFVAGTNDDDPFSFKIASEQGSPIQYLASARALMCFTTSTEYTIEGGVEKPITPTNVQIKARSNKGTTRVRPLRVDNEEFFVQRSGKKLMAFGWNANAGDWGVTDSALLSEHLMKKGIAELSYHPDESRIYAVLKNGNVAACMFSRDQDVSGWALWTFSFAGGVRSMAVIPTADGDQVYAIISRSINGATKQYVEVFTPGQFLDCSISGTDMSGATVWTAPHLEGKTVGVIADGYYMGQFTVVGGNVTLPSEASNVTIGIENYPTIQPFSPEVDGGVTQGNSVRVGEVTMRFLETTNCQINGDDLDFRGFGSSLTDKPLPEFTGLKRIETLGWERGDFEMTITAKYPFDFHLLSLIRKITVND